MLPDRSSLVFVIAFLVIGLGFFGSTLFAERRTSAIDHEISHVATNSLPSVAHLIAARGALRHLEVAVERFARSKDGEQGVARRALVDATSELDAAVAGELETPNYEGELPVAQEAQREVARLEALVDGWVASPPDEGDTVDLQLHAAVDRTDAALQRWLALNAQRGQQGVARIVDIRRDSMKTAVGLDAACIGLSVAAAIITLRALRKRREAEAQVTRAAAERAEELAEMLRLNETFVAALGHDLRNPLNSIVMAAEVILGSGPDGATRRNAERVRASGHRMAGMIDDLFDLARARLGGGIALEREHVDLFAIVDNVVTECRAATPGCAIDVRHEDNTEGDWDPARLSRVVSNLVGNAVRHGAPGGQVDVVVTGTPASVSLAIHNRGAISPDVRETLFEPFRRASAGGDAGPGLGLGLYIVEQLVSAHRGSVGVESSEARGTTFRVQLPRAARGAGQAAA